MGRLGRFSAFAYAYSYVFFTGSVIFALLDRTSDYGALSHALAPWMIIHGAIMLLAGVGFGVAAFRAGVVPRWTGGALMAGVVLVALAQSLPEGAQVLAAAVRDLGFAGMGAALLRHRRTSMGSEVKHAWTQLHAAAYRATGGRLLGRLGGQPILLLHTIGRRTGRHRVTPVEYVVDGEQLIVVAANAGALLPPAWYLNLLAQPAVEVRVGSEMIEARAHELRVDERERIWARLASGNPGLVRAQRKAGRTLPVIVLTHAS
jgi:deazaflavin-dependent oxidoreductase (nitroreductase family)